MMFVALFLSIALAAAPKCFTEDDMRNRVCWALCRHDGSDTGYYDRKTASCICGQRRAMRDLLDPDVIILPDWTGR